MKSTLITVFLMLVLPVILLSADQQEALGTKNLQTHGEIILLQERIDKLRTELRSEIEFQQQITQTSFSGVSTHLAAVNTFLEVVAVFMAVLAIGVGIYITLLTKRMSNSYRKAQELLKRSESVKTEVDQLNEMITNNWSKLYKEIKEEETRYIIARLKNEPKDISNFGTILISRDLSNEYYPDLKASYLSFKGGYEDQRYTLTYIVLFFQHYAGLSFFDPQLADSLKLNYYTFFRNAFKKDILNTTRDLVKAFVDHDFHKEGKELIVYLSNLKMHARDVVRLEEVLDILWEGLISKENRFAFYQMMPDEAFRQDLKVIHGRKLIETYDKPGNTESENLILTQARELLATMQ